jgi:hypothetical protein
MIRRVSDLQHEQRIEHSTRVLITTAIGDPDERPDGHTHRA